MVKWFRCTDNSGEPIYWCRGESAEDCRWKGLDEGVVERTRIGMRVLVHCDRAKAPDVFPLVFRYCYRVGGWVYCRPSPDSSIEVRIPLREVERSVYREG